MTKFSIKAVPNSVKRETAEVIEKRLLRSLANENIQSKNVDLVFSASDENGDLIGGVTGSTSYGWLLVKTLWVENRMRGAGLGRQLMATIEAEARALGCHGAWLDTSNAKARSFYLQLGYRDFGRLENEPDQNPSDHTRWFMRKPL